MPHSTSSSSTVIFEVPPLSLLTLQALDSADLVRFCEVNRTEFTMLVCALYSGFVEETKELRQRKPKPDTLFELFCTNVYAVFTAANPQRVAFMVEKGEVDVNGIAFEFLWEHLRRQGILTYQDFYGNGKRHPSKVVCLVRDFVHFVAAKGFENGAANCASDPSRSQEARRFVLEINTGVRKLKPV